MQTTLLQVENLTKRFEPGGLEVLRGVSFGLGAGESLSVSGSSGCGKTTLLNLVGGLEAPSEGRVLWEGAPLPPMGSRKLAALRGAQWSFVFQNPMLLQELSLFENCLLPARIQGKLTKALCRRVEELLDRVGLAGHKEALIPRLSGGERQRGALVRALSLQPKLLLADEPTGSLDEGSAVTVMDLLLELCTQTQAALILITHNPHFAQRTQHQAQLSLGKWIPLSTQAPL